MQTSEQRLMPESAKSSGTKAGLSWLGVAVGACILAVHSFSGQAIDDATLAPLPMTGATLSTLHAAIPAGNYAQESAPSL
jgi:hypothetical protein